MTVRKFLAVAIGLTLVGGMAAGAAPRYDGPKLAWVIKSFVDKKGNPHSRLLLSIDGKLVLIERDVQEELRSMARDDFVPYQVPKKALIACYGWFAGAGDEFYVIRKANAFAVYRQMGDCSPDSGLQPWRRIKTIRE